MNGIGKITAPLRDNYALATMGQNGLRVIDGTDTSGDVYVGLKAIGDTVFTADVVRLNGKGDTVVTAITLVAGDTLMGLFTNVVVASGKLVSYL